MSECDSSITALFQSDPFTRPLTLVLIRLKWLGIGDIAVLIPLFVLKLDSPLSHSNPPHVVEARLAVRQVEARVRNI